MSFLRYCKRFILGTLGTPATAVKNDSINLWKTLCLSASKNTTSIKKDIINLPKTLMFTTCKKSTSLLTYFLGYCTDVPYLLF